MQGFNFELLAKEGIDSHYIGLVARAGELLGATDVLARRSTPQAVIPDTTRLNFVNRVMPRFDEQKGEWDYSAFQNPEANNYVHPLELMSRNDLPEASSVWKRVRDGQTTMEALGLPADFKPGDTIPAELIPILDYSTKFEPDDRYLTPEQARQMAGLSEARFAAMNETTRKASRLMTDYAESRGFKRLDGKVEQVTYVFDGRQVDVLGDAVCTWHEDRLMSQFGIGISKQRIRDKIKKLNQAWYDEIQRAKKQAKDEGVDDFRKLMDPEIKYVSPDAGFFHAVNRMFQAATNQWVDGRVFEPFPGKHEDLRSNLERAIEEFRKVA
jgi:phosphoribosylaminoimidazole-succinocarboxamide synthase